VNDLDRERVIQAAIRVSGRRDAAKEWLTMPQKSFNYKTPLQLIEEGRAADLIRYLASFESGFVG